MLRSALITALAGLALAIALPTLHLSHAGTWALVGTWWPVVLVVAGIAGLVRRNLLWGPSVPAGIALLGAALLAGHLLHLPVGALILAAILLALSLRFLNLGRRSLPARLRGPGLRFAGDIRLGGPAWRVETGDIFQAVGEIHLDLVGTRLPEGTTRLRLAMLAGEIEVTVPAEVGVQAQGRLWAGSLDLLGHQAEGIGPRLTVESDDFATATRRLALDFDLWAGEVVLRRRG